MHTEEHTKYHMIEHGQILKKNRKILNEKQRALRQYNKLQCSFINFRAKNQDVLPKVSKKRPVGHNLLNYGQNSK